MTQRSDRPARVTPPVPGTAIPPPAGSIVAGALIAALGALLAAFMTYALVREFLADDFFGVCVSGMVVVFSLKLAELGLAWITGKPSPASDPDPLARLWTSPVKGYPFGP